MCPPDSRGTVSELCQPPRNALCTVFMLYEPPGDSINQTLMIAGPGLSGEMLYLEARRQFSNAFAKFRALQEATMPAGELLTPLWIIGPVSNLSS